jgi:hypothetical protein
VLYEEYVFSKQGCLELFCLVGYYALQGCLKPMFRDYLWVPSYRVKLSKKTLEYGTDSQYRNVGLEPPYAG